MIYARFIYAAIFILSLVWVVISDWLLDRSYGVLCYGIFHYLPWCYYSSENSIGYYHLMKVSFSLFCFHLCLLLLTIPASFVKGTTIFKNIHRRLWWIKVPLLVTFYVCTLVIPNPVYLLYMVAALILSVIFVVCQVMLLTEFAVRTNNAIITRIPEGSKILLIALSVTLLIVAALQYLVTGTLYFFCFPVWPLYMLGFILVAIVVIFSIAIERGSLFVAAVLSLFFTFMVVLAIESNSEFWAHWINSFFHFFDFILPNVSYCPLDFGEYGGYWFKFFFGSVISIVFKFVHSIWGGVFLVIAVVTACISKFGFAPLFAQGEFAPESGYDSGNDDDKESGAGITYHYWQFHALMTLASAAIPVAFGSLSSGFISWYLPVTIIVSVIIGVALYLWGLAAPVIFKDRQFFGPRVSSNAV
ncbi:hypothetical protein J8273_4886 [Carpediemonas membranifera]|uniref:Uncharacterized protein n=1 Tax=Carpediemonas membranifera TaxID=201153 RepID=A0A8J6B616_9EUKA|nr:hypothetical protein J8273_4886 [Carpediemonas membranifera]|eukprot:KAG9393587.1 hypothetical protein J8273_4886 [Carpediemonas membranifera]